MNPTSFEPERSSDEQPQGEERRQAGERRGEDRRKRSVPVEVERRRGNDRRSGGDRRNTQAQFARFFAAAFA